MQFQTTAFFGFSLFALMEACTESKSTSPLPRWACTDVRNYSEYKSVCRLMTCQCSVYESHSVGFHTPTNTRLDACMLLPVLNSSIYASVRGANYPGSWPRPTPLRRGFTYLPSESVRYVRTDRKLELLHDAAKSRDKVTLAVGRHVGIM